MTSLKELSDRARACTNAEYKAAMVEAHIQLVNALERLQRNPTEAHLRDVQCFWAYGRRVLKHAPNEADPQPPLAGAPVAAILAA